jgi:hypothetical protein
MEQNTGFSPNALIRSLRTTFDNFRSKCTCDEIQEIMNLLTDLEHEVHLLQTNYSNVTKQNDRIVNIDENTKEIFHRLATSEVQKLASISEEPENSESHDSESHDSESHDSEKTTVLSQEQIKILSENIANLVVEKISEIDASENDPN